MVRILITLTREEAKSLDYWARDERRDPRDQVAVIVREALLNRGLLHPEPAEQLKAGEIGKEN